MWDFRRSPETGQVTMWARDHCRPRWIGAEETPAGPPFSILPNPLNSAVAMIRLDRRGLSWAEGRPVAVVGEVAAGRYDVTVAYHESGEEVLLLPPEWARPGTFALRVRGHSMAGAGIAEGDYVIVRPQSTAESGDLVIAGLTDAEDPEGYITLKQLFWEGDHIRLQPANSAMAPIHLYPRHGQDPVEIQGKVVAVVRVEDEER
jgi:repressor LexA